MKKKTKCQKFVFGREGGRVGVGLYHTHTFQVVYHRDLIEMMFVLGLDVIKMFSFDSFPKVGGGTIVGSWLD